VALAIGELVRAMMDSEGLGVTDINQPVITAPAIRRPNNNIWEPLFLTGEFSARAR
jgi:hypothetical protein